MNEKKYKAVLEKLKQGGARFPIEGGLLIPVSYQYKTEIPDCVHLLNQWRMQNPGLSPAQVPISDEKTERWLQANILGNDSVVLFMIRNSEGESIGHIGLSGMNFETNTVRICAVTRGIKEKCPGIMQTAVEFIKVWCAEQLEARFADLLVLSDNSRAISLYTGCGFYVCSIIPLRKAEQNGKISWIEDMFLEKPEKFLLHMVSVL